MLTQRSRLEPRDEVRRVKPTASPLAPSVLGWLGRVVTTHGGGLPRKGAILSCVCDGQERHTEDPVPRALSLCRRRPGVPGLQTSAAPAAQGQSRLLVMNSWSVVGTKPS